MFSGFISPLKKNSRHYIISAVLSFKIVIIKCYALNHFLIEKLNLLSRLYTCVIIVTLNIMYFNIFILKCLYEMYSSNKW